MRYYTQYDGEIEITNKDVLTFNWVFSDGAAHPNTAGSNPLSYIFYKAFVEAGDNWAELSVSVSV